MSRLSSRTRSTGLVGALAALAALAAASPAGAITREEIIGRAKAYAYHPWRCSAANLTASCNAAYHSVYPPGDYLGLPYDWGGYMTLFEFDQEIAGGYGAGSYPDDGVLSCTAGVDCSGFVSKAWASGHFSTSTVDQGSSVVALADMRPGDIFNDAGYHMALYSHTLGNGEPALYESVFYNVHFSLPGWSWVDGYTPRRYSGTTGTSVGDPLGTPTHPIPVGSLPFVDARDTTSSPSDLLDGCGAAPGKSETGREYVYAVDVTQPGTLHVSVQDDVGVDIDVHVYTSMNTNDCIARADIALDQAVDCGTYYVVADTFKGAAEYPGPFTLTVTFTPSGQACGSGPPGYDFEGALGSPCAYPGHDELPFCNPNLDATTCVYTSSSSFCSKACTGAGDCTAFAGGCCEDLGNQEFYCLEASLCSGGGGGNGAGGSGPSTGGGPPGPIGDAGSGTGGGSAGSGTGATGGAGVGAGAPGTSADPGETESSSSCALGARPPASQGWLWALALGAAAALRRRAARPG
ncbi:MAG: hypothetical protein HY908_15655 [Myxococcales bacterium]|nr:hypothetical protein [Myxococcales bacterium]